MSDDNRIILSPTRVTMPTVGQDHDNYPPPQGQVRYDHMRTFLIGLLSQQSSESEPSERRDGTPWFDMNSGMLKIWYNGQWREYSEVISLNGEITLIEWYNSVANAISAIGNELFYGGKSSADGISDISIPSSLQSYIYSDSRAFVVVNGQSVDPRTVQFIGNPPTSIRLNAHELEVGDEYFITIRRVSNSTFVVPDIVVP